MLFVVDVVVIGAFTILNLSHSLDKFALRFLIEPHYMWRRLPHFSPFGSSTLDYVCWRVIYLGKCTLFKIDCRLVMMVVAVVVVVCIIKQPSSCRVEKLLFWVGICLLVYCIIFRPRKKIQRYIKFPIETSKFIEIAKKMRRLQCWAFFHRVCVCLLLCLLIVFFPPIAIRSNSTKWLGLSRWYTSNSLECTWCSISTYSWELSTSSKSFSPFDTIFDMNGSSGSCNDENLVHCSIRMDFVRCNRRTTDRMKNRIAFIANYFVYHAVTVVSFLFFSVWPFVRRLFFRLPSIKLLGGWMAGV